MWKSSPFEVELETGNVFFPLFTFFCPGWRERERERGPREDVVLGVFWKGDSRLRDNSYQWENAFQPPTDIRSVGILKGGNLFHVTDTSFQLGKTAAAKSEWDSEMKKFIKLPPWLFSSFLGEESLALQCVSEKIGKIPFLLSIHPQNLLP